MNNWIPLSVDDLALVFSPKEVEAIVAPTNSQFIAEIMADVVAQVRESIANNPSNALDAGDTIPRTLRAIALDIIAVRALKRYARTITDERKEAAAAAIQKLSQIAEGAYRVIDAQGSIKLPEYMEPSIIAPRQGYGNDGVGFFPTP